MTRAQVKRERGTTQSVSEMGCSRKKPDGVRPGPPVLLRALLLCLVSFLPSSYLLDESHDFVDGERREHLVVSAVRVGSDLWHATPEGRGAALEAALAQSLALALTLDSATARLAQTARATATITKSLDEHKQRGKEKMRAVSGEGRNGMRRSAARRSQFVCLPFVPSSSVSAADCLATAAAGLVHPPTPAGGRCATAWAATRQRRRRRRRPLRLRPTPWLLRRRTALRIAVHCPLRTSAHALQPAAASSAGRRVIAGQLQLPVA